jgi:hypothetical protein
VLLVNAFCGGYYSHSNPDGKRMVILCSVLASRKLRGWSSPMPTTSTPASVVLRVFQPILEAEVY